ncbi:MAG TPA: hypothetical protein VER96_40700 [Polyangiaceae bacterium]|nr:hypothetical protein [Polyangiaceae bacterium]
MSSAVNSVGGGTYLGAEKATGGASLRGAEGSGARPDTIVRGKAALRFTRANNS